MALVQQPEPSVTIPTVEVPTLPELPVKPPPLPAAPPLSLP
jgi:hypothetical protein